MSHPKKLTNHHYLSQMYLRRWTTLGEHPQPSLFVYSRGSPEPDRTVPKKIGYEPGMYAIDPHVAIDGDPEIIEKTLSKIEGHTRRAFDYIDAHGRLDSPLHVHAIANFLAVQVLRTRKGQLALERRIREHAKTMPQEFVAKHGGFRGVLRFFRSHGVDPAGVTEEGLRQIMDRSASEFANSREFRIGRIFETGRRVSDVLRKMNWSVVTAEFPAKFITGDAPVLLPEQARPGHPKQWWEVPGVGVATPEVEIWFPLDPSRALVASAKPFAPSSTLARASVQQVNTLIAEASLEFVVCHRKRPQIAKLMAALAPTRFDAGTPENN